MRGCAAVLASTAACSACMPAGNQPSPARLGGEGAGMSSAPMLPLLGTHKAVCTWDLLGRQCQLAAECTRACPSWCTCRSITIQIHRSRSSYSRRAPPTPLCSSASAWEPLLAVGAVCLRFLCASSLLDLNPRTRSPKLTPLADVPDSRSALQTCSPPSHPSEWLNLPPASVVVCWRAWRWVRLAFPDCQLPIG